MWPFIDFRYQEDSSGFLPPPPFQIATIDVREIVMITVRPPAGAEPGSRGVILFRNGRDLPAWASPEDWVALREAWMKTVTK